MHPWGLGAKSQVPAQILAMLTLRFPFLKGTLCSVVYFFRGTLPPNCPTGGISFWLSPNKENPPRALGVLHKGQANAAARAGPQDESRSPAALDLHLFLL